MSEYGKRTEDKDMESAMILFTGQYDKRWLSFLLQKKLNK